MEARGHQPTHRRAGVATGHETLADEHGVDLVLADGRLPTGAHTQSAGVEPALRHGMRVDEVPAYLRVRLATVTDVRVNAKSGGRSGDWTRPA